MRGRPASDGALTVKPGDHPEFFRFPAPEGRSRESTIRLDRDGRFFHDGALVEHDKLARAMHGWISRHPDDGRYILTNGYDWTYFTVEGTPFFVRAVRADERGAPTLELSDGSTEPLVAESLEGARLDDAGALVVRVKRGAKGGPYEARLDRHAQAGLEPWLEPDEDDAAAHEVHEVNEMNVALAIGGRKFRISG